LTEESKKPQITLKNGGQVEAEEAGMTWIRLGQLLETAPDQFRSLLALAEGRPGDADKRHFQPLWGRFLLEQDHRTVPPLVRAVLQNCYQNTPEGPVITPLRLQHAADKTVAEQVLRERARRLLDFIYGPDDTDTGRSRG
jgi:hypothetical protein